MVKEVDGQKEEFVNTEVEKHMILPIGSFKKEEEFQLTARSEEYMPRKVGVEINGCVSGKEDEESLLNTKWSSKEILTLGIFKQT